MTRVAQSIPLLMALCTAAPVAALAEPDHGYARSGPYAVRTISDPWRDASRERILPVKFYAPQGEGPFPVILFSHGLGGSREGGSGWGSHWASHGFLSVHLQHPGSDESLWRSSRISEMRAALLSGMSVRQFVDRNADVAFVIDEITRRVAAADPDLRGADLSRIGMSGHSFGARTTLAVAGERFPVFGSNPEPRISAAVGFSPAATGPAGDFAARFGSIAMPFMSITGTDDDDVVANGSTPDNRLVPFQNMRPPAKYLLVLRGGNHMVFNGVPGLARLDGAREAVIFNFSRAASTAFWKAHLLGDGIARAWLTREGLGRELGADGEFLFK